MTMGLIELKSLWADKFRMPTIDQLRQQVAKPLLPVFDDARATLNELDGVSETLQWQGVPWRWTLVYRFGGETDSSGAKAVAYLIPDPQRIQICVPLSGEQIETCGVKKLKRPIRDGVLHSRSVAGVWWPTWDLPSKSALDEVLELVERKHKNLAVAIGA